MEKSSARLQFSELIIINYMDHTIVMSLICIQSFHLPGSTSQVHDDNSNDGMYIQQCSHCMTILQIQVFNFLMNNSFRRLVGGGCLHFDLGSAQNTSAKLCLIM